MKIEFDERTARARIQDTQERYRDAMDAGQIDAVVSTFARDGSLLFAGRQFHGPLAIRNAFAQARRRPRRADESPRPSSVRHVLQGSDVRFVSSVEADVKTAFTVQTSRGIDHTGTYVDRFVEVDDGRWLLARRQIVVDSAAAGTALGARSRRKAASARTSRVTTTAALRPSVAGGRTRHVY